MHPSTRKAAIALRQKIYFTGKPCKNGHLSIRNTITAACRQCIIERTQTIRRLLAS